MNARPLNILQVLRAPVGGLFRHVADLSQALAQRGHRVGLVVDDQNSGAYWSQRLAEVEQSAALGVTRLPLSRAPSPSDLIAITKIARRIQTQSIDVVHGHGAKGGALARLAGSLARRRCRPARFYTPHGGSLHFSPTSLQGRIYLQAERALARQCEAILFESRFAKEGFAQRFGLSSPHWPVIANGLHAAEFDNVIDTADAADFVFIGEMRAIKGVDVLLEALKLLPPTSRAVLVGAGPQLHEYQAYAMQAGLATRARFLPPMPARQAFALGHVVVAPSRAESLPYLLLEAAAAGRPMIATAVGGVPEIFGPAADALVPAGDHEALAAAMLSALADMPALVRKAEQIRAGVRHTFSIERMADAVEQLYCANLEQREKLRA